MAWCWDQAWQPRSIPRPLQVWLLRLTAASRGGRTASESPWLHPVHDVTPAFTEPASLSRQARAPALCSCSWPLLLGCLARFLLCPLSRDKPSLLGLS